MAELTHKSHQELRRGWKGNQNESQFENISAEWPTPTPFRCWDSFLQNLAVLWLLLYKVRNGHQIDTPEHTKLETISQCIWKNEVQQPLKLEIANLKQSSSSDSNSTICTYEAVRVSHWVWNSFSFIAKSPFFIEGFRVELENPNLQSCPATMTLRTT